MGVGTEAAFCFRGMEGRQLWNMWETGAGDNKEILWAWGRNLINVIFVKEKEQSVLMGLISVKTDCFFYSIINSWFAENIEIYVSWGAVYAVYNTISWVIWTYVKNIIDICLL